MSSAAEEFIAELEHEAKSTREQLKRVPADKFEWKPQENAMPLGILANHIATSPGETALFLKPDSCDASSFSPPVLPQSSEELVANFDRSVEIAKKTMKELGDEGLKRSWSLTMDGKVYLTVPKKAVVREWILSHWYHHRGQMQVYLRILGVPVPSVYGGSGDESPF